MHITNDVIIFDGDDTLWKTQMLYDLSKAQFVKLMKTKGFSNDNIIELLDKIDAERVEIAKFSKTRFFESMLIIYAFLCGKQNKNWDIHSESKIRELGFSIFSTPKLYDEAIPTLEKLSRHFDLILFTNGDEKIQRDKIDSFGEEFKSYFFKIYISEMKNEHEFRKIVDDLDISYEKVWVVGNSIKSDINPALKLGLKAILLPRGVWKYEESKLSPGDVSIVKSLLGSAKVIMKRKNLEKRS